MENKEEFNSTKAHKAQTEYCKKNNAPHFAPIRFCFACRRDIYGKNGYSVKGAGECLITGCPLCHRSYCD